MREIKFRGKRKDNGEWVYGYYLVEGNAHFIIREDPDSKTNFLTTAWYEVSFGSVGQFTERKVNGKELYEKDIVKSFEYDTDFRSVVATFFGIVRYNKAKHRLMILDNDEWYELDEYYIDDIVGNTFENPDFFKKD